MPYSVNSLSLGTCIQSQRITKCAPLLQNRILIVKATFCKLVKLLALYDSRKVIIMFTWVSHRSSFRATWMLHTVQYRHQYKFRYFYWHFNWKLQLKFHTESSVENFMRGFMTTIWKVKKSYEFLEWSYGELQGRDLLTVCSASNLPNHVLENTRSPNWRLRPSLKVRNHF